MFEKLLFGIGPVVSDAARFFFDCAGVGAVAADVVGRGRVVAEGCAAASLSGGGVCHSSAASRSTWTARWRARSPATAGALAAAVVRAYGSGGEAGGAGPPACFNRPRAAADDGCSARRTSINDVMATFSLFWCCWRRALFCEA
jgi:hypothetical protein